MSANGQMAFPVNDAHFSHFFSVLIYFVQYPGFFIHYIATDSKSKDTLYIMLCSFLFKNYKHSLSNTFFGSSLFVLLDFHSCYRISSSSVYIRIVTIQEILFSFSWIKEIVALIKCKYDFIWYLHFTLTLHRYHFRLYSM